ncbi:pre-mRNA splicing factor [Rhizophagus clarus]|uniref:Pre-mRNA splicing factor n=1 Tax=Rhizophagus clarus TaxID=94130 RepID=A0A8H3QLR2_9GLOM|nr:pre-mRNA splicing factor [Rhizophagus clarus]
MSTVPNLSDNESDFSDLDQLENQGENINAISETIAGLLEQLSNNMYQYDVHVQYIQTLRQSALFDELKEAREMMHSIFPLSEEMWREWIEDESRIASTKEEKQRIIQLYSKAVQDYLSINLWKGYTSYIVQEYKSYLNEMNETELENESECTITLDQVRKIFDEAIRETCYYITESHQIWDAYKDFEIEILEASPRDEQQKIRVEKMFESRLKIPHATVDKTFSDYSSFITKYDNSNYENVMIETNKYVSEAKNKYYERDQYENALTASDNTLDKFMDYIEFEKKPKKPVVNVIRTLYERAIAKYYLDNTLWENYMLFLIEKYLIDKKVSISTLIATAERSVRNCSWSGDLWGHYIRILEKNFSPREEVLNVYNRALSTAYKGPINQENGSSLVNLLEEGIKTVKETFQIDDPYYRLEKYLIEIETLIKNLPKVRQIWNELSKNRLKESEFWIRYADWEKSVGNFDDARKIYKRASQQNTDWPERIFDAWEQFEHQYGTVDNFELAIIFIKKQMTIVAQRRERAALKEAQNAQSEGILSQVVPTMQIAEGNEATDSISSEQYSDTRKRKPEGEQQLEELPAAKRSKAQRFEKPKRDREFATIIVSNLPIDAKEGELKNIFHECGKIKEIRFLADTINAQKTAYIEFNEKESVPAALTKDKKRIGDREISVYRISERILFVTNFSPSVDIEELFKKYGEILSVRKPSNKYKNRVFCYVEFKERNSAQAALEMNGREIEPGKKIIVMISNPLLKKERSPPIQKEVSVRNLPSNLEQSELKSLFQTYGPVTDVRIPMTDDNKCRGFAFIDFENKEHAEASLALNSTEFKGCILNVALSEISRNNTQKEGIVNDREKNKKFKRRQEGFKESERRSKTVTFTKLPKDTTEKNIKDMLSQYFKDETIRKITMSHDRCAYVEFEHIEDAGKAALHFNKYKLNNTIISAVIKSDLPSTVTELAVQRDDKPAGMTMIPRRLVTPSSKLGIKGRHERIGVSSSSKKGQLVEHTKDSNMFTENQDVETKDENTSKKSNDYFRNVFYNASKS